MRTLALVLLVSCGVDPNRVPAHVPFAATGEVVDTDGPLTFGVVGATRTLVPSSGEAADAVIADIAHEVGPRHLNFVVLTGDYVRRSASSDWEGFGERWGETLVSERPADNPDRTRVVALAGADEHVGDKPLTGFGAAFKGEAPDIGLNRVASWGSFDVKVGGQTWRMVYLDAHEKALGSRWQEELFWLPKVVEGDAFDHLLVFLTDPLVTTVQGGVDDRDDDPSKLLSIIDEHSGMMKLVGVFSGGAASNSVILPTGAFGEAHFLAGNAGVPAATLLQSRPAPDAKIEKAELEPGFDAAIRKQVGAWKGDLQISPKAMDQIAAGTYDGSAFPVQGWWIATLDAHGMTATLRMRGPNAFADVYSIHWNHKSGWQAVSAPTGG